VRPVAEYLAGHLHGAINVPVSGASFSTKAGFVLDAAAAVTVLARTADEAQQAITGLHSVAFLDVVGVVLGAGPETTGHATVGDLEGLLEAGAIVVDVRERDERDEGYIPGSRSVPYRLLRTCCPDLPEDRPIVTICSSGPRAAIAASILRARGLDARPVVDGGMSDWLARGATTVSFRRCGS
jgi:hydroxyacylglutathione hydrolase